MWFVKCQRKDFKSFCNALERHGRYAILKIIEDVMQETGKAENDIKRYYVAFWLHYRRISGELTITLMLLYFCSFCLQLTLRLVKKTGTKLLTKLRRGSARHFVCVKLKILSTKRLRDISNLSTARCILVCARALFQRQCWNSTLHGICSCTHGLRCSSNTVMHPKAGPTDRKKMHFCSR